LNHLWATREAANGELLSTMRAEADLITDTFRTIDEIIELFDSLQADSTFARVCGFALAKARHFAFGCLSLVLDGLGQEAGALMRPFLEAHELLIYFRLDHSRAGEALEGRLPPAGKVAKLIKGQFHDFRKHLNESASHFGFTTYSLRHLLDGKDLKIRTVQPMLPLVLRRNIRDLWLNMILLLFEAFRCLQSDPAFEEHINSLAQKIESIRERGLKVFEIEPE